MQYVSITREPLISVIVTCYNHAKYLSTAIESILVQSCKNIEIIVVDDGSTDNTKQVAVEYVGIIYIYQTNQGLSAARNKGIEKSTGELLVFLDADDWLVPNALLTNLKHLEQNPTVAFVSGAFELFYELDNKVLLWQTTLIAKPYCHLLEKNFIGMHASVLFQRWIFNFFRYDTSLKSCEDYDLYLKIVRKYTVNHHTELIAVYRIHENNMSSNYSLMLEYALLVLNRQRKLLENKVELEWFKKGLSYWKSYYSEKIFAKLLFQYLDTNQKVSKKDLKDLKQYNKYLYIKFNTYIKLKQKIKILLKKTM